MIDFVSEHWNNTLTILAFLLAAVTTYYQVKHYRDQQPDVKIHEVTYSTYNKRTTDPYTPEDEEEEVTGSKYSVSIVLENDGRDPAAISDAKLHLYDTEETIYLSRSPPDGVLKLDGNGRIEILYSGKGRIRDDYSDDLTGTLRLDSTTGVVERDMTIVSTLS